MTVGREREDQTMPERTLLGEAVEQEVPASSLIPLFSGWEELSDVMAVGAVSPAALIAAAAAAWLRSELDGGPQAIEGLPDDSEAAEALVRAWLTAEAEVRPSWKCLALLPPDGPDVVPVERRRIDPADPHRFPESWDVELVAYQTCTADDPLGTRVTLLEWPGEENLEDWLANESRQAEAAGQGRLV